MSNYYGIIALIGEYIVANSSNNIVMFDNAVKNMMQCRLIMVDKHIASLLSCVADVPVLKQTIADSIKTASYATEYSRARVTFTRPDGVCQSQLKLPVDKYRLFTFVVCLLLEVDSGKRDFIQFLEEYYPASDSNISYAHFVEAVLRPFRRAGQDILKTESSDKGIDLDTQAQAEACFVGEKIYISADVVDQLAGLIDVLVRKLHGAVVGERATNQECQYMCMCMLNALLTKNPKLIKVVWIGFRNTLLELPTAEHTIVEMYNILTTNKII